MVGHTFNPSTGETEAGQPDLHSKFQGSQSYIVRRSLEKAKQAKEEQPIQNQIW